MRILMLSTSMGLGGADRQILELAGGLVQRGHRVRIVSLVPLGSMGEWALSRGLSVETLNMHRGVPDPRAVFRLARIIRRERPDVVHSHMFHANVLARVVRPLTPVPALVSTLHSVNEGGWWTRKVCRVTDSLSDLTTHVSKRGSERFVDVGAVPHDKILHVPNAIDPSQFRPDRKARARLRKELGVDGHFTWLAVGRFVEAKDHATMLRAFAEVVCQWKECLLLIVGEGPLEAKVRGLAVSLGIADSVLFVGRRHDMSAFLNVADAYLMSSAWEGVPMALLEAAATSLPMVATDAGGVQEVLLDGQSGFLAPIRNPRALGNAMLRLMRLPPHERERMGEMGRRHVEARYAISHVVLRWEAIYEQLLGHEYR